MAIRERCPECRSSNIIGRDWETSDGEPAVERHCYDCGHEQGRASGAAWLCEEALHPPHRSHTATGLERTLLDEIYAAPDDDGVRSIYADWLIERGDPRGTFIVLQLARAARRDPIVSAHEQALLDANWSAWIGEPSTHLEASDVAYERGFWSACCAPSITTMSDAAFADRAWGTVRDLVISPASERQLPRLLGATARSVRSVSVPSRPAFMLVTMSGLPIERLELGFDVSRERPLLTPIIALPALRTLALSCDGDLAERWLERAAGTQVNHLVLAFRPHVDDLRRVLGHARNTKFHRLSFELPDGIVLHAQRDSDGTLAVRTVELCPATLSVPEQFDRITRHLMAVDGFVDPGLKVTMPAITGELARMADALGLRLVRAATSFAARPRVSR